MQLKTALTLAKTCGLGREEGKNFHGKATLKGVLVAGSRSMFCMELIELILILFRFFGFSALNKSYGVLKSKFSVFDRHSVKMALHHVIITNQLNSTVNLWQTCQATKL